MLLAQCIRYVPHGSVYLGLNPSFLSRCFIFQPRDASGNSENLLSPLKTLNASKSLEENARAMSDSGGEMDVDGPARTADVTFSAEAAKGKRSAANLPVEAEDSLPW